jgi:hypothetical protein
MNHGRVLFTFVVAMTLGLSGCSALGTRADGKPPRSYATSAPSPERALPDPGAPDDGSAGADLGPAAAMNGAKPNSPPDDSVPSRGNGAFTVAPGGTDVVGHGNKLITYRVEVENGIAWGADKVWTAPSFAAQVDKILADPRGWTASAAAPITDPAQHLANASWSFQRTSGTDYSVRMLLATPDTTDSMCGSVGMDTGGVYSCRYGNTILINLRRWLNGAPGFAINLDGYHSMVINHEMGHRLGFKHMTCPAPGSPAPIMQEVTINLGGCVPNAYPFSADGVFYTGPWSA